jgi:hypothetical protein
MEAQSIDYAIIHIGKNIPRRILKSCRYLHKLVVILPALTTMEEISFPTTVTVFSGM